MSLRSQLADFDFSFADFDFGIVDFPLSDSFKVIFFILKHKPSDLKREQAVAPSLSLCSVFFLKPFWEFQPEESSCAGARSLDHQVVSDSLGFL